MISHLVSSFQVNNKSNGNGNNGTSALLKIRTNIDENYEIHSTSSKSIDKKRFAFQGGQNNEDEALSKFLNTYDKEYSQIFERIDKLKKSTSRERPVVNHQSVDNKRAQSFVLNSQRGSMHQQQQQYRPETSFQQQFGGLHHQTDSIRGMREA